MQTNHLRQELTRWTAFEAPTGFEEPVLAAVREELLPLCDSVELDVRGNLYGTLAGTDESAPRVMLTAHADEIGFIVTALLPGGFVRFARLGGPTISVLPGQRIRLLGSAGPIEGVIGVKPGHILQGDEAQRVPAVDQMYVDVGAESVEQLSEWGIEPGTPGVFVGELVATSHPHRMFGKSVDNRAGIVAVLNLAKRFSQNRPACHCQFVITVEEEIGLRGAAVAAIKAAPDVVIAIDTVPAGGTPELRLDELSWTIGAGPLLKVRESHGLSTHGPLRNCSERSQRLAGFLIN